MKPYTIISIFCAVFMALFFDTATSGAADVNLLYVNGIQNTHEDATKTMNKIQGILALSPNHTGNKKTFSVSMIWNPIGWTGSVNDPTLVQDIMELFLLKTAEEWYGADFQKIMVPYNQSKSVDTAAAGRVTAYLDEMTLGGNYLVNENLISDEDMAHTQSVAKALAIRVKNLGSAVVVAHSEGNLLANLAYAKLVSQFGDDTKKMIRVINVANTSEFSVNNLNFTHAGDGALSILESLPSTASVLFSKETDVTWWRTTPQCTHDTCDFTVASPTFGAPTAPIPDQGNIDQLVNHSMQETYLSTAIVPIIDNQGLTARFVDRFEDFVYTAANSFSSPQTPELSKTPVSYGRGNDFDDKLYTITNNQRGGYLAGGYTDDASDIYNSYNYLIWVISVDENGKILWQKSYGKGSLENIIRTRDGNYLLICTSGDGSYLLKINENGNLIWGKNYQGLNLNSGIELSEGGAILFGRDEYGYHDSLLKVNEYGDIIWVKTFAKYSGFYSGVETGGHDPESVNKLQ